MSTGSDSRPGTAAIQLLISRLMGLVVPLTAPAWVLAAVQQSPALTGWWSLVTGVAIGTSAVGLVVAGVAGKGYRVPAAALATAVGLALLTWPIAVVDPVATRDQLPWLWLVLPLACAAVASLGSVLVGLVYGVAVGTAYGFIRLGDVGGRGTPTVALLEGLLLASIAVGFTVLVVAGSQAAYRLDAAAAHSAAASAAAARAATADLTRRELDAVVHDTVLAALHAAVREPTREQAPPLAAEALRRLEDAGAREVMQDGSVPSHELGLWLHRGLAAVAPGADLTVAPFAPLPPGPARAIADATLEAARNARRHGGGTGGPPIPSVRIGPPQDGSAALVEARISDDGVGFDPALVPSGRIGLAVSVVGRMRRAGGDAVVTSTVGHGTTVRLTWPAAAPAQDLHTRDTVAR